MVMACMYSSGFLDVALDIFGMVLILEVDYDF